MKKIYTTLALAMVAALTASAQNVVADFENIEGVTLNADGYYIGRETSREFNNYGAKGYYCDFKQGPFRFSQSYTPSYPAWSGFAISNRTETAFNNLTPDQYNNVVGGGYSGSSNFCVVYGSMDSISIDPGTKVNGFYITNSAYSKNSFTKGDSYAKALKQEGDFFKVTVTGVKADRSEVKKEIMLAEVVYGSLVYINNWRWVDLSDFGEVSTLRFSFTGSDTGQYGLNTPAYCVIDNLTASVTTSVSSVHSDAVEVSRYTLNGIRLSAPQKGVNIVKMSDGTTRKEIVR